MGVKQVLGLTLTDGLVHIPLWMRRDGGVRGLLLASWRRSCGSYV